MLVALQTNIPLLLFTIEKKHPIKKLTYPSIPLSCPSPPIATLKESFFVIHIWQHLMSLYRLGSSTHSQALR